MERRQIPRPQRILIAEDSDDIRLMWKAWLTYWGFAVDEARNGAEAVRKCQAQKPDLVLMDLWMPVMDGLSATAQLQRDASTSGVPVLALSASGLPSTAERAREAGCAAFVAKPVEPDELIEHLRKAFARMRSADSN